jgi:hypothetical protein
MAIAMNTIVELHNKGNKTFESMWDSKPITIKKGKHIDVVYGLALHFQEQSDQLDIQEKQEKEVEPREPINPLEENHRGTAFEGIGDE